MTDDRGPLPEPSAGAIARRLVRETLPDLARDYSYAFRYGARGMAARLQRREHEPGDGPDVVVVTGIWEPLAFLHPIVDHLQEQGFRVHVSTRPTLNLEDVEVLSQRVREFLDELGLAEVVLVAHSKGGLVAKQVLLDEGVDGRVRGAVVLGTPWGGSALAGLVPEAISPLSALAPGSDMLAGLSEHLDVNRHIVNVYPEHDPVVPSTDSLRLPGAHNVQVGEFGHFAMLSEPRVLALVTDALVWFGEGAAGPPPTPAGPLDPPPKRD